MRQQVIMITGQPVKATASIHRTCRRSCGGNRLAEHPEPGGPAPPKRIPVRSPRRSLEVLVPPYQRPEEQRCSVLLEGERSRQWPTVPYLVSLSRTLCCPWCVVLPSWHETACVTVGAVISRILVERPPVQNCKKVRYRRRVA